MRQVRVRAPEGQGSRVAELALAAGAAQVSTHQVRLHQPNADPIAQDVVEVETATPIARRFVEALLAAPFYEPATYALSIVHPRAVLGSEQPAKETLPIIIPTIDVYEELWQFSHITVSLVGRVF